MTTPVSGWRITASELKAIVSRLSERIDAAALAPEHWNDVVDGLQAVLPNLRVGIEARDIALEHPIAMAAKGWSDRETQDYIAYYSSCSPWVQGWQGLKILTPYLSDAAVPLDELKKTEFYNDWLRPIADAEHGTGMKLFDSGGRAALVHMHYGTHRMEEQHAILAAVLAQLSLRMRGALLANRVLALGTPPRPKGSIMDSLLDPAFLLDHSCRLLAANAPGDALLKEESLLAVGAHDAFQLRPENEHRRLAKAVETLCRVGTSWSGQDIPLSDGTRSWVLSLLPVAPNNARLAAPQALALFLPRALALAVLRPVQAGGAAPPTTGHITLPPRLTPAERRFAEALCEGGSLPQIAARLGIAYETARTRLKSIYGKTGTHSQRELIALLIRGR